MRLSRSLAMLAFALVALCGFGFADSTFDFSSKGNGDIGPTDTFTTVAGSIALAGFTDNSSVADNDSTDLFFKNGTGDENGLGLNDGDVDNEISGTAFIQFTAAGITSVTIGSVQAGPPVESFTLWGSNTPGTLGTFFIASGSGADATISNLLAKNGGYTYIDLVAPTGNVLLDSATNTSVVPEPGTPALIMSLGLVGLCAFGRRKLTA